MKKVIVLWITAFILLFSSFGVVAAQTVIPEPDKTIICETYVKETQPAAYTNDTKFKELFADTAQRANLLGCAIKTGRLHLYMAPYFITYIIQFLLGIAGLISILFIVYGGFQYTVGGLTEDKESGKKTIMHAILGLIVSLSAWIAINFIQAILTS